MRVPSCPEVGRSQRPRPHCQTARTGDAVKQREPAANIDNASRTATTIEALLDRRRPAALPGHQAFTPPTGQAEAPDFGAQYRQIARRRGPNKAAVAVAHSLIELVWHLLSTGEVYEDLGEDYFTKRQDPARRARRLITQLEELGFTVTLEAATATTTA